MPPVNSDSAPTEARRRKLVFRCWHRGTREMDLLLGRYVDAHIGKLSEHEIGLLEALLDSPDPDLFAWISGAQPVPPDQDTTILASIRAFHLNFPTAEDVFRP